MEESGFKVCREITRSLCQDFSTSAALRTVPLETSLCLVLLGMPVGVTGLWSMVVALKPWKQVQLYLLPCCIIRTRVCNGFIAGKQWC